jgi:hypothetical protein
MAGFGRFPRVYTKRMAHQGGCVRPASITADDGENITVLIRPHRLVRRPQKFASGVLLQGPPEG